MCEVADKKTIKHDKPRNINEYSRCTPGKIPNDLRSLAFSSRYYPINPYMFVLSGQFADVGRTLGLHCRCLRMFPGRVTLFTDVPSLFADVLTKPADLAIGDHRAPQSGQCKPGFSYVLLRLKCNLMLTLRCNTMLLRVYHDNDTVTHGFVTMTHRIVMVSMRVCYGELQSTPTKPTLFYVVLRC